MSFHPEVFSSFVRSRVLPLTAAALLLVPAWGCSPPDAGQQADLVLRSGRVVTVDEALPEAQAVAVRGARIVFIGSDVDVEAYVGDGTSVVDLDGRLAIPGFIEGHAHLMGLGQSRLQLDLMETKSYRDLIDMVAEAIASAEPGDWIVGRGLDRRSGLAPEQVGSAAGSRRARLPDARCVVGHIAG